MGSDPAGRLRRDAAEALRPYPVQFAYLFGSRAEGRARKDSDVDVAVLLLNGIAEPEAGRIASRCASALSAAAEMGGIQVTVLNHAPLRFVGRVLRQRIVIYSRDEPARVAYESLLGRMADDVEIWAAPMDRALIAAIAAGRR
ncbi:MAG: nucleotidyltransferase domain-containing protein [Geodermatophilaceae bacterium]|nr:nucleotidyltransferase domain-containing protein [Geodermatophilaceae bacterium]